MNWKDKIIITYGTFDNFHIGHLKILQRARKLWTKLIVWISTDEFNEIKNKKCIYPFEVRKAIIEWLSCVDKVIPENNWEQKVGDIKNNNVDIFVIWDDWKGEFDFLSEYCDVQYFKRTKGISTSKLKDKFSGDKFLSNWEKPEKFVSEWTWPVDHYIYKPLVEILVKKGMLKIFSPNFLTTVWLILAICSSILIVKGYLLIWLLLYILFPFIDLMDGAVARYYRKTSTVGAFYDGLVDAISEILILLAVWYYFWELMLFIYLLLFILFIQVFSNRLNWILEVKERQLNFLKIKGIMLFPVLVTRNDTRKILLFMFALFNSYILIIMYFAWLYALALLNWIFTLIKRSKEWKK